MVAGQVWDIEAVCFVRKAHGRSQLTSHVCHLWYRIALVLRTGGGQSQRLVRRGQRPLRPAALRFVAWPPKALGAQDCVRCARHNPRQVGPETIVCYGRTGCSCGCVVVRCSCREREAWLRRGPNYGKLLSTEAGTFTAAVLEDRRYCEQSRSGSKVVGGSDEGERRKDGP